MAYDSVFKPGLFSGQTILVTGGGSGIGRCVAHELAHLGAHVVLVGRKAEKLEATAGEIIEDGGSASWQACDIRDEEAVKAMVKAVVAERGPIHHLVNNAGGQFPAPLIGINQKGFETVVRTNLVGGFLVAKEVFLQSMSKTGGSIVNMLADMWAACPAWPLRRRPRRHGELHQDRRLRVGPRRVRVNAVAPGWIASSGMDTYPESMKSMIRSLRTTSRCSASAPSPRWRPPSSSCSPRCQLHQRQHHPHRRRRQPGHPRLDPGQGPRQRVLQRFPPGLYARRVQDEE